MTGKRTGDAMERAAAANERHRPVHVGTTMVTRPASAATPTVFSFLRHVRGQGLDCVPEPLDHDDERETLRFIDGASGGDGWQPQHHARGVESAARLLRRIHDASLGWTPPRDAIFGAPPVAGEEVVFCHGDPGPWNLVWREGEAVALIDWDFLHPRPGSTMSRTRCSGSRRCAPTTCASTGTTSQRCRTAPPASARSSPPTATSRRST